MSALEIVMISISSVLLFTIIVYIVFLLVFKKISRKRAEEFDTLNNYANHGKIVFVGDSLTDFYPVHEFFPGLQIFNRGIAGDRTSDIEKRIPTIIDLEASKLFLQIGINDFGRKKVATEEMVKRILHIASRLEQKNCQIYIISLYPLNRSFLRITWPFRSKAKNKQLQVINQRLGEECNKLGYKFIDMYQALVDDNNNLKREFTIDGIHLSIAGYQVVSQILSKHILD